MPKISRRCFLQTSSCWAWGALASGVWVKETAAAAQPVDRTQVEPGERLPRDERVHPELPRLRIPLSFIIDDSTCLVNLAHFAIPQFAQVFPDRYRQNWRLLPREIPDSFVERFMGWCREHGVKGKYSLVPYPACVGWLDRDLPGWSQQELQASLELVRRQVMPDWDIHPEMISHTFIIDTHTGRPFPYKTEHFMENWRWTDDKSAEQIADYMAYALRILKNTGIMCSGITTPGGFGNRVLPQLAQATLWAVREECGAEIPHYFRHVFTDQRSVQPRVEYATGLKTERPACVVSIIGCTGDWFGGWDGMEVGHVDQFLTADGQGGRLAEVLARKEPAILVCHWPGIYWNGYELGFRIFQQVVARLQMFSDDTQWMKLSDISRYWAARELTGWQWQGTDLELFAPFAVDQFTLRLHNTQPTERVQLIAAGTTQQLVPTRDRRHLQSGQYWQHGDDVIVCFSLPRGASRLQGCRVTR
ncbi:MAG: hypothetical protein KatS3mg113_0526 [Planctomycetaceae bacterium]|nr:MAG: hypothetical protein KatS3mg113_0526 [Planctomycetaceae bacterium]